MNTELIIPENSEVANAVGAALGYIYESAEALVRKEKKGNSYCLFLPHEKKEFKTKEEAVAAGLAILKNEVSLKARKSGSENAKITAGCEDIFVDSFGNKNYSRGFGRAGVLVRNSRIAATGCISGSNYYFVLY